MSTPRRSSPVSVGTLFRICVGLAALAAVYLLVNDFLQTRPGPPPKVTGNTRNDELLSLDKEGRSKMLEEIILHKWEVSRPFYMGMPPDSFEAFWNFHCPDGRDFVVEIGDSPQNDRILNCDQLMETAHVSCFKTFAEQEEEHRQQHRQESKSPSR